MKMSELWAASGSIEERCRAQFGSGGQLSSLEAQLQQQHKQLRPTADTPAHPRLSVEERGFFLRKQILTLIFHFVYCPKALAFLKFTPYSHCTLWYLTFFFLYLISLSYLK
jgi:hypothetical protein